MKPGSHSTCDREAACGIDVIDPLDLHSDELVTTDEATDGTKRIEGKWVVIPLMIGTAIVATVFLAIQISGRGTKETNFVLLSYTAGLRDLEDGYFKDTVKNMTPVIESGLQPDAYGWRGEAYLRLEKYVEAETDFREAIEHAPQVPANQAGLGAALAGQNRLKEALSHLDKAIELHERPAAPPPETVRRWGDDLDDVVTRRAEIRELLDRAAEADR